MTFELTSWREGAAKQAILDFVSAVTAEGGDYYVAPDDRLAVFDNDGTLWSERPLYFQLLFAIDRVVEMAPEHPEWATTQPFQAVLEDDHEALVASGEEGLVIVSPIPMDDALASELETLGPVRLILAPNLWHYASINAAREHVRSVLTDALGDLQLRRIVPDEVIEDLLNSVPEQA